MVQFFQSPYSPDFNLIECAHSSCLGALNECLNEMKAIDLLRQDAEVFLLENHALTDGFPDTDVLLFTGFSLELSNKLATIGFEVGVSMKDDVNLYKHYKAISYLHDRFRPQVCFDVYSPDAVKRGTMTLLDGSLLSPVAKTNTRCVQLIDFTAASDITSGK